jgi:DNA polymerase III epsilon subunit-like protein
VKAVFLDTEYDPETLALLQLSYIEVEGPRRACRNFYFRAEEVAPRVQRLTGLAPGFLCAVGTEPGRVREEVLAAFSGATLVAHHLNRDKRVLERAFGPLPHRYGLCTMYRFARVLRLPGGRPYKMPSLAELLAHYGIEAQAVSRAALADFGAETSAHDARFDAEAVCLCAQAAAARGDLRDLFH